MQKQMTQQRLGRLTPEESAILGRFLKDRKRIIQKWRELGERNEAQSELAESREDWLARTIYRKLRLMVRDGRWTVLQKRVDYQRSLKRGRYSIESRPFKIGLIAFLGETIPCLPNRRSELSNAMEYAYIHRVPSKYFNGFVKQAGQKKIAAKLKGPKVEPGFKKGEMLARP